MTTLATTPLPELTVESHTRVCEMTASSQKGRGARGRTAVLAAAVVALAMLLGGCRTVGAVIDTTRALDDANFSGTRVTFQRVRGTDRVRVKVRASSGPAVTPELQAAHIVWDTFKFRFDAVDVKIGSRPGVLFPYAQLQQLFGPRPSGYDDRSVQSDLMTGARRAAIVGGIIAVIVIGGVVLTIVLIVRHRRRRPPPQQPWYGPPPGQPAWPQPGPGGWPPPQQPWAPQPWPPPDQGGQPPPGWPPPGQPQQPPPPGQPTGSEPPPAEPPPT